MGKLLLLVAVFVGFVAYQGSLRREETKAHLDYQRAVASAEDPCQGKTFCVVVYMAPWCGACTTAAPLTSS